MESVVADGTILMLSRRLRVLTMTPLVKLAEPPYEWLGEFFSLLRDRMKKLLSLKEATGRGWIIETGFFSDVIR